MKKIKKATFLLLSATLLSLVIYGCCEDTFRITGSGSMQIVDMDYNDIDSINGPFQIALRPDITQTFMLQDLNMISSAYALSCATSYENSIIDTTLKLKCNKAFRNKNKEIAPGSDFIELSGIEAQFYDYGGSIDVVIKFDENFIQASDFSGDLYTFTLEAMTDDNLMISGVDSVYINL